MPIQEDKSPGMLHINWKTIALGSLLVNLAAIAGISAVSIVKDADVLSTVALLLAIIAFICQLIVYAIQTSQSSGQLRQAKDLNASTETLLAEVRTRIEGTQQMMTSQHQELVRLTLLKSTADVARKVPEGELAGVEELLRDVESAATLPPMSIDTSQPSTPLFPTESSRPSIRLSADSPEANESAPYRWTLSNERAHELSSELKLLGSGFSTFAIDLAAHVLGRKQGTVGAIKRYSADEVLIEQGFVKDGPLEEGERTVVMTGKGLEAGELIAAPWPPPDRLADLSDDLWALRETIPENTKKVLLRNAVS